MLVRVIGRLRITALPVDGTLPEQVVHDSENIIVDIGMQVFSRMLGGNAGTPLFNGSTFSSLSDVAVATMRIGKMVGPPTPAAGDTVGVYDLSYAPVLVVSYPTATSVKFSGVIPAIDSVGHVLTEEALFVANGALFAKRTLVPGILKTSANALRFDHSFDFSRQV